VSIAVCVNVNDGVVLAADSAATVFFPQVGAKVYDNACKIANLHRDLPLGAVSTGLGGIGRKSMAMLMKEFRAALMGQLDVGGVKALDPERYTIDGVAHQLQSFVEAELATAGAPAAKEAGHAIEFVIAGQPGALSGSGASLQVWGYSVRPGETGAVTRQDEGPMIKCLGVPEWVGRLLTGVSPGFEAAAVELGLNQGEAHRIAEGARARLAAPILHPAMPLMDAIALARFLVNVSVEFQRLLPNAPIVGGPVEIAAITRFEGFVWVSRKHYYSVEFNPAEVPHDHRPVPHRDGRAPAVGDTDGH